MLGSGTFLKFEARQRAFFVRLFLFFLCCEFLCGCFSASLPEPHAPGAWLGGFTPPSTPLPPEPGLIALLPSDTQDSGSVGHQFVLGIFPVTRLKFPRGAQNVARELVIDYLTTQGRVVVLGDAMSLAAIDQSVRMQVFGVALSDVRVNAFDLLFVRKLCVDGMLQINSFTSGDRTESRQLPLHDCRYRMTGYPPQLASIFQEAIEGALRTVDFRPHDDAPPPSMPSSKVVALMFPTWNGARDSNIAVRLSEDSGYRSSVPLSPEQVGRIIQEGLDVGVQAEKFAPISFAFSHRRYRALPLLRRGVSLLETSILEASLDDKNIVRGAFEISLRQRQADESVVLSHQRCYGKRELSSGRDLPVSSALRDLSEQVLRTFLASRETADKGICIDRNGQHRSIGEEGESNFACCASR